MKDLKGVISYKMYFLQIDTFAFFTSFMVRLIAYLKGVKLGRDCRFWGITLLVRHPDSLIKINSSCRFRSSPSSNLIGVPKKCTLSTHSAGATIIIGERCGFTGTAIGAFSSIVIGNDVLCGSNTLITDFDWHNVNPQTRNMPIEISRPVVIEDNVFIGYGSTILKGVHIGKNSVIGANSVVSGNIPANVIASGNPARVVKSLLKESQ